MRWADGFASGRFDSVKPLHPIDMINDWGGERVTIWKTILSLLRGVGANHFEGAGLLSGLVNGWGLVEQV